MRPSWLTCWKWDERGLRESDKECGRIKKENRKEKSGLASSRDEAIKVVVS
jgi:hypothetical protein